MTTYSKATVFGHPIHPMLVGIPVVLYIATVLGFAVYATHHDPRWFQLGLIANAAAIVAAVVAAVPGLFDWTFAIPSGTEAKRIGAIHMIANLSGLVFFGANLAVHRAALLDAVEGRLDQFARLDPYLPLSLTAAGISLVILAGAFGVRLVHTLHVGDVPTPSATGPGAGRPIRH